MASRLFRSIVVFGTTLGAGAAVGSGCDLSGGDGGDDDDTPDARTDAWFGIIDAPQPDAAPDATPDAGGDPDAEPPPDALEPA